MFVVFQDGKRADISGYPEVHYSWGVENNTHSTFERAVEYAHNWAYPGIEHSLPHNQHKMELNIPIDMGMSAVPVMMEIRRIEE